MSDEQTPLLAKPHHNTAGLSPWRFRMTCAAVWGCSFFAAFDGTVLAALTSDISSAFNASSLGSWLGTAYLLTFCCFTPIYGRLADILGRRGAHAIAMTFFTVGTLGCAVAPTMNSLIAARLVAGIGGGGVQSIAVIVLTDIVDLRHRGLFQGYANIVFGSAAALGGPVGGWLSDTFGWRYAFAVQVAPCAIASVFVWFVLGSGDEGQEGDWREKAKRIDYLGSLSLIVAVGSLILALSMKTSDDFAWSDTPIWGLLVASLLGAVAFLFIESKVAQPILPLSLLGRRTPLAVALSSLTVAMNQFSILYNIPLFFSTVKLASAGVAGMHILPYSGLIGAGSVMVGWLIRHSGRYWTLNVASAGLIVISQIMLCTWTDESPAWMTWVAQMPSGLGYAGVLTASLVALMNDVNRAGKGEM
jgi:MFS family permease